MKINVADWRKIQGSFETKVMEWCLEGVAKFYVAFFKEQSEHNTMILLNNITGLKKEIVKLIKASRGDRPKLKALSGLESLVANGERQIQLDLERHATSLQAHVDLRDQAFVKFNTVHKNAIRNLNNEIAARIATMKDSMKAKSRNDVLRDREMLIGILRSTGEFKVAMVADMVRVRDPKGAMQKAFKHLSKEAKNNILVPKTNKVFAIYKQSVAAVSAAEKNAEKWAGMAQKLADSWPEE